MHIQLGIRSKLFLISLAIIVVMAIISGVYIESHLRSWLESRIETELQRHASSISTLIENTVTEDSMETMDGLADSLGSEISSRVTFIAESGVVLGDSEVPLEDVPEMDNHGDRREFRVALGAGLGVSRRYSTTLETSMMYVAVPYEINGSIGVVRVSMPLTEVDRIIGRMRTIVLLATFIGLLVAILMTAIASHLMSGALRTLVDYSKKLAEGGRGGRLVVTSRDEVGGLAGSINLLGEELENVVDELATERNHLEGVLEAIDDGVLAIDGNQVVTLANSAVLELLGQSRPLVGKTLLETIQVPALYDAVGMVDGGTPVTIEFVLPGMTPTHVLAHITSHGGGGGRVIVLRDVTEIRKLENARRDFFANASHELRTPVGIIQANAETLERGALEDSAKAGQFIDAITRNSARLSALINDLLQISRIEAGKYHFEMKTTPVRPSVDSALNALANLAGSKDISMTTDVPEDLAVFADENALEDVLFNLVDNAVKYTGDGGRVSISAKQVDDLVLIEVEDNGTGIAPDERDRIFERFYRIDKGRSREMGGTGLGLSIVKHLVTAMNGEVSVRTATPKGSIFTITLKA